MRGPFLGLLERHRAFLSEIQLVADKRDSNFFVGVLPGLVEPTLTVLVATFAGNVVSQNGSYRAFVVATDDATKHILPSGIPDLQLNHLVIDRERD
jgi:hypothetical protein